MSYWVDTEDWHTAGEPFRIVRTLPDGCEPAGETVAERRKTVISTPDHPLDLLRQTLVHEPRGHADMYGGFIVPPNDAGAVLGVMFWHKDGFSTACGHGTIALGCWAFAHGLVQPPPGGTGVVDVPIDVPSGRVVAQLNVSEGKVASVDFVNVPSYQLAANVPVALPNLALQVDLSFGGAVYASLPASAVGLEVTKAHHDEFVHLGREIKAALGTRGHHGTYDLYGVIFYDDLGGKDGVEQRNVTVFADGAVDRSPCGSGTAARVASLVASGRMKEGTKLTHHSIVGTTFEARATDIGGPQSPSSFPACVPCVRGMAHLTGRHSFFIDPSDPVYPGFVFR